MSTVVDITRYLVFMLGTVIFAGVTVALVRAAKDKAWGEAFWRNIASIAGVGFVLLALTSRFGQNFTWRIPLALVYFAGLLAAVWRHQKSE